MKITYLEKGPVFDFKRIDTVKTITLHNTWKSGGLLYGYRDRYNVVSIAIEDIIKTEAQTAKLYIIRCYHSADAKTPCLVQAYKQKRAAEKRAAKAGETFYKVEIITTEV